jgi:Zn-dependent M28 family amino/carboxypeptidase
MCIRDSILGAHYDGPGRDGAGTLYPAANDNGSGVAVLLEVVRAWQAAGVQPARPVLFAAWDGEELDQRGARSYLVEPAMPLTQTVGMLNLDNVGAGQGFFVTYEGDRSREALLNWAISTASQVLNVRADLVAPEEDGDHMAFQEAGMPATLLIWSGATDDANTSRDEAATLDAVKLRQTGRLVTLALRWLAQ